jgi:recombinational DNA repair ATPase RecF
MKIKKFTIKNFRNITDLEAEPNGSHILLLGDNQRGKTSTIEAILSALGKKDNPVNPVKFGKETAEIEVEGTDGTVFKVKYNRKGEPQFEVIAPNGLKDSRKSAIQQVVGGDLDFDVEEFVKFSRSADGRRKQIELVKSLLPDEIVAQYNEFERTIASLEKVRTDAGRNRDMHQSVMKAANIEQFDIEKYAEKLNEAQVSEELLKANEVNENRKKGIDALNTHKKRIEEIDAEILRLKDEKAERENKMIKLDEWMERNKAIDFEPIKKKLSTISEHNLMHGKVKDYAKNSDMFAQFDAEYGQLSVKIEEGRRAKKALIAESDAIPIKGLWFDEDKLYLGQVPIDSDTLSTSQVMHLGVQIMVAKNPKMKIMCIGRGESLGTNRLKEIQALAEQYGYEIIMEQVMRGEEDLRLEFYVEGEDISKIK